MLKQVSVFLAISLLATAADKEKLTGDQRIEIVRGMMAEYATAKVGIPRSKKPLPYDSTGKYDRKLWDETGRELGPAARVGDLVQITKITIEDDQIVLELNGGMRGKRKWYQNLEVGMGGNTRPVSQQQNTAAPGGTTIAMTFEKGVPPLQAAELKKMLAPVLDFEKRSATEQVMESLPPEIQSAVKDKRAIEGMDREQVIMAMGKPRSKTREIKDGVELEDWIYGVAPGKITFVTFDGSKVVRVKETYAGLGGQTLPPLPPR